MHINADGDKPGLQGRQHHRPLRGRRRRRGPGRPPGRDLRARSRAAIADGARIIVLSDRHSDSEHAPIPSLLLTGAVHHHLIREKTRTQVGLVVETGDVREVHHVALLVGFGASAVNPYLAMETVEDLANAEVLLTSRAGEGRPQPGQGARQGRAEGHVEDGRLDRRRPTTVRRSSRRSACRRTWSTGTSPVPPRSSVASVSTSSPRRCAAGTGSRYPPSGISAGAPQAGDRRRVPVAPRGRAAPVRPGHRLPAAALDPRRGATTSSSSTPSAWTTRPSG